MVPFSIALFKHVGIVAAGLREFGLVTGFSAEDQGVLKVSCGLVQIRHRLRKKSQQAIDGYHSLDDRTPLT